MNVFYATNNNERIVVHKIGLNHPIYNIHGYYIDAQGQENMIAFSEDLIHVRAFGGGYIRVKIIGRDAWLQLHAKEILTHDKELLNAALYKAEQILVPPQGLASMGFNMKGDNNEG